MTLLMSEDVGQDHKHWLADVERWQNYSQLWSEQQASAVHDAEQFIKQYRHELQDHVQAIEAFKHLIANCERAANIGSVTDDELQQKHALDSQQHEEQRAAHERLKSTHHRMMLALAMLKNEPFLEE